MELILQDFPAAFFQAYKRRPFKIGAPINFLKPFVIYNLKANLQENEVERKNLKMKHKKSLFATIQIEWQEQEALQIEKLCKRIEL